MKRAVLMVIDGLRSDLVRPEFTPHLSEIARQGRFFPKQKSIFPSATRISSASIATGCYPSSHGLAGNTIALDEGDGLKPVSVGPVTFRERWRAATGGTLNRPTLAERLAPCGGVSIYSNSSPGAAHMLDPDGHGWLRHRSGSHAPGFNAITGDEHLDVTYDAQGDRETIRRFTQALLNEPEHPLHITWICEPDHSQHSLELGSPEHLAVLACSDERAGEVARAVEQMRRGGDDVLFIVAADHGHETTEAVVPVNELLIEAGFKATPDSTDAVLASSGMGALIYLSDEAWERCPDIASWLKAQNWCAQVYTADEFDQVHVPRGGNLAIAFAMAKSERQNRFGIRGIGPVAGNTFSSNDRPGVGQHGGLGVYETNPLLLITGSGVQTGISYHQSSTIDIAPTLLHHLDQDQSDLDGAPLPLGD